MRSGRGSSMPDALRHGKYLARPQFNSQMLQLQNQHPFDSKERLIGIGMVVPEVWLCHARDAEHMIVIPRDDRVFVSSGELSRLLTHINEFHQFPHRCLS